MKNRYILAFSKSKQKGEISIMTKYGNTTISVYTDASWDTYTKVAALAVVFSDGRYERGKSCFCEEEFLHNSNFYELESIAFALTLAKKQTRPGDSIVIFSDSAYSIHYLSRHIKNEKLPIKENHKDFKPIQKILNNYRLLEDTGISVEFKHSKDKKSPGLRAAHKIANYSRRNLLKEMTKTKCKRLCEEAINMMQENKKVLV